MDHKLAVLVILLGFASLGHAAVTVTCSGTVTTYVLSTVNYTVCTFLAGGTLNVTG